MAPARLLTQDLPARLDGAGVAVVRILGGYRNWQDDGQRSAGAARSGRTGDREVGVGRMRTVLQVRKLHADLLARQDAPDVAALAVPKLRILLRRRGMRMVAHHPVALRPGLYLRAIIRGVESAVTLDVGLIGSGGPIPKLVGQLSQQCRVERR